MPTYDVSTVIAPMPNLENLKKQAKQYLRWHRERHHPVAAEIRAALPRYRHLDDRQVLEAAFKLSDAQELVARQLGFSGWPALKAGIPTMSPQTQRSTGMPILSGVEPQLYVADVVASLRFFTSKLGFGAVLVYGEPPFYAIIERDRARLCIRRVEEPVFVGDVRQRQQLLSASITVDSPAEIKQLFLQFQAAGVGFLRELQKEPWGARNFIVLDPDGNLILFAGPSD